MIGFNRFVDLETEEALWDSVRPYLVEEDGSNPRPIAEELGVAHFSGWAPDGGHALVSPIRGDRLGRGVKDVYRWDSQTGDLVNLSQVEPLGQFEAALTYWPSGKKMFYTTVIDPAGRISVVGIVDPDGRHRVDISGQVGGYAYCPQVSPDERQMVFHSVVDSEYKLYIADVAGGNVGVVRRLDTGNRCEFVVGWSPDGRWILLVAGPDFKRTVPWLIRPDGTESHMLTSRTAPSRVPWTARDTHGASNLPGFAPRDNWVAFSDRSGESLNLFRIRIDGSDRQQVTFSPEGQPSEDHHPVWSPDGEWIAFGSNRAGVRQLYAVRTGRVDLYPITLPDGHVGAMHAHWQPRPRAGDNTVTKRE